MKLYYFKRRHNEKALWTLHNKSFESTGERWKNIKRLLCMGFPFQYMYNICLSGTYLQLFISYRISIVNFTYFKVKYLEFYLCLC